MILADAATGQDCFYPIFGLASDSRRFEKTTREHYFKN